MPSPRCRAPRQKAAYDRWTIEEELAIRLGPPSAAQRELLALDEALRQPLPGSVISMANFYAGWAVRHERGGRLHHEALRLIALARQVTRR